MLGLTLTLPLLEMLARRKKGWLEELTGLNVEIPGEWYWWVVGIVAGLVVLGKIIEVWRRP